MASRSPSEGLRDVVAGGDYRRSLEAIRDRLAAELVEAEGAPVASIAKQLAEVLAVLESMPVKEGSAVDDLAKRRADRRATQLPDAPAEGVKRGTGGGRTRR